jgi:predicted KAP-like P-loop ATPase
MAAQREFSDTPISSPEQDQFGLDPFAASLAKAIQRMPNPNGTVIALNGPWGSGKSSVINLLKKHLNKAEASDALHVLSFNPWWFRGEEALAIAFFQEIATASGLSSPINARHVVAKIASKILRFGSAAAPAADVAIPTGLGVATGAAMGALASLVEDNDTLEKLHEELSQMLTESGKRFLVIIDDIDRLEPAEALAMFKLIKSVGRLPNMSYLLAFDRNLAEKAVESRFPSEGPHYLEKIIQVSFDLPIPEHDDLVELVSTGLDQIVGEISEAENMHVLNMFHEIVMPEVKSPRDAVRYLNALSLTWPTVKDEVNVGDFIAIEAVRVFRSGLYNSIKTNSHLLCGTESTSAYGIKIDKAVLDAALLHCVVDKEAYKKRLVRLFPRLEAIWSNTHHNGSDWKKRRRIASEELFPMYFRLSLPSGSIPKSEIDQVVRNSGDVEFVKNCLVAASKIPNKRRGTRVAVLLEALRDHATDIPLDNAEKFLTGVFSIVDEIHVEADKARAFSTGDNRFRVHWLLRKLLLDRTTLNQRSAIISNAMKSSSLFWSVDLALSAWEDYYPTDDKPKTGQNECLTNEVDALLLKQEAIKAIIAASENGELIANNELAYLLYRWRDLAADDGKAVKKWTSLQMGGFEATAKLASGLLSTSWSQSGNDVAAKRKDVLHVASLDSILNSATLRMRLEEIVSALKEEESTRTAAQRCLTAWKDYEAKAVRKSKQNESYDD